VRHVSSTGTGDLKVHLAAGLCVCRVWCNGEVADAFMATRSDTFLINFRCVLNVACFLLGNFGTLCLSHLHRRVAMKRYLPAYEDGTDRVFQNVGI
jgi:hypothetical protein